MWDELADVATFVRRRLDGEPPPQDGTGFDPELNATVLMPAARAVYRNWFRVRMRGLENIPDAGAALVVANHSGVLPFDMVMVQTGIFYDHPRHRNLRLLGADLVYELPWVGPLARKSGHTIASPAEASRLLSEGQLVGVCPEGYKGMSKPFRERYKLRRFGRGGFALSAIRARVPIIPCAIVGAEEIYPMLGNARGLARMLGLPYFPVTPLFPWLGPVGMIPLPSNWLIEFGAPIPAAHYARPADATDPGVTALATQVRDTVQDMVDRLVAERGPAFG